MKTSPTTLPKTIVRKWHVLDASSAPMGRLATRIATLLRGKHKRDFTPHMDCGDFVVVTNVAKIKFTGRKVEQKLIYTHSRFLGGLKTKQLKHEIVLNPDKVLWKAVREMLDDVKFRPAMLKRMKLVKGESHVFPVS